MAAREYRNSLFGCFGDIGTCFKAFCCPCVVFGKNHHRIEHGTDQGYDTINGWCASWCLLGCLGNWGCILQALDRRTMQGKHNLQGSGFGAFCTSCCCGCCELVQTHRELDYVLLSQNDHAADKVGYKQQPGMVADQKAAVHEFPQAGYPDQPQVQNGFQQNGTHPNTQTGTQQYGSPNGAQLNGQTQPVMHS